MFSYPVRSTAYLKGRCLMYNVLSMMLYLATSKEIFVQYLYTFSPLQVRGIASRYFTNDTIIHCSKV